jgi:hypothetical protein
MLHRFHVNVYAKPSQWTEFGSVNLRGEPRPAYRVASFDAFLPVTFEQAIRALAALPRLDAEPDGFFVVAGDAGDGRWQLDGHLFDFGDRLHRVELHGSCPATMLDMVLACFGWPNATLAFELVQEGVTLEEPEFLSYASGQPQAD